MAAARNLDSDQVFSNEIDSFELTNNNLCLGTENTPMIVGLGIAARLVSENVAHYEKQMKVLQGELETKLVLKFDMITINGRLSNGRLPNTVSVTFNNPKLKGHRILSMCNKLRASVGAACHSVHSSKPSAVLIASGIDPDLASCTIRLSLGRETQMLDVENAVDELAIAVEAILRESES